MHLLRYATLVAFSAATLIASDDALQRFHGTYRGMKTISFSFTGGGVSAGKMVAKRGGMYRVTIGDRTVVSNGKMVWNATSSTKTVIISDYKPSSAEVSIERVFFDVMSVYRSTITSQAGGTINVRLDAPGPQAQIAGITSVDLTCDTKLVVKKVRIASNGAISEFTISKLSINPHISDRTFTYDVPRGWQSLDIR